jgi:hypothetical protein
MSRGLPNLRLPEAPGIRKAPTLRQQPDDAVTPPRQFHLPTTSIGPIGRIGRSRSIHPSRQTETRPRFERHPIRGYTGGTCLAA